MTFHHNVPPPKTLDFGLRVKQIYSKQLLQCPPACWCCDGSAVSTAACFQLDAPLLLPLLILFDFLSGLSSNICAPEKHCSFHSSSADICAFGAMLKKMFVHLKSSILHKFSIIPVSGFSCTVTQKTSACDEWLSFRINSSINDLLDQSINHF